MTLNVKKALPEPKKVTPKRMIGKVKQALPDMKMEKPTVTKRAVKKAL